MCKSPYHREGNEGVKMHLQCLQSFIVGRRRSDIWISKGAREEMDKANAER